MKKKLMKLEMLFSATLAMFQLNFSQVNSVFEPFGGQKVLKNSTTNITFTFNPSSTPPPGPFTIEYSTDNGLNWTTIDNNYSPTTSELSIGNATYIWNVPNITAYNNCLVRVEDNAYPSFVNSWQFSITSGTVDITYPTSWQIEGGTTVNIGFDVTGYQSTFKIEYSTDGGTSWNSIDNNFSASAGSHSVSWTVPTVTNTTPCQIHIYDDSEPQRGDYLFFNILPGILTCIAPTTNTNLIVGSNELIEFNWSGNPANFDISYSTNSGISWNYIVTGFSASTGFNTYNWTVPNTPSSSLLLKIKLSTDPMVFCSNNFINITNGTLNVSSPTSGETLIVGDTKDVIFNYSGQNSTFTLSYSTDGGMSWLLIDNNIAPTSSSYTYNWTIPPTPSENCLLKVQDNNDPIRSYIVQGLKISNTGSLTILTPNGGETLIVDSTYNIEFSYTGPNSTFKIAYSSNYGNTWNTITTAFAPTSSPASYSWTVPNTISASNYCKIKVSDVNDLTRFDISDYYFKIAKCAVSIIFPNGGDFLMKDSTYDISFSYKGSVSSFKIEYSSNYGNTWHLITDNFTPTSSPASYAWTVPSNPSTTYLIRITENGGNGCFTESEGGFAVLTGLEDEIENAYMLYPNPTNGIINISRNVETEQPLKIYTIDGKVVKDMKIMGTFNQISFEEFDSGIYIIQIGNSVQRIVKN